MAHTDFDRGVVEIPLSDATYVYQTAMSMYAAKGDGLCARMDRLSGQAALRALFDLGLVDEDNHPTFCKED